MIRGLVLLVNTRETANVCAPSLAALRPPLPAGFARVRHQPHLAPAASGGCAGSWSQAHEAERTYVHLRLPMKS
jgi:hypothetical protein